MAEDSQDAHHHVLVRIRGVPGRGAELEEALLQLAADSLATEHCMRFEVNRSLREDNVLWLVESFPSPEAYDCHVVTDHAQRFLHHTLPQLVTDREVLVLRDETR